MRRALKVTFETHPEFELLVLVDRFLRKAVKEHELSRVHELEGHLEAQVEKGTATQGHIDQLRLLQQLRTILDAFNAAFVAHKLQQRRSGEPFIVHPVHVALYEIYHELHEVHETNLPRIVAALLHDTVENTHLTLTDIQEGFGAPVRELVDRLTTSAQWDTWVREGTLSKLEEAALQYTKAAQNVDALEVKIADRLDNLRTLTAMPENLQTQKVIDTIAVGYVEKAVQLHDWLFLRTLRESIDLYATDRRLHAHCDEERFTQLHELRELERQEIVSALATVEVNE